MLISFQPEGNDFSVFIKNDVLAAFYAANISTIQRDFFRIAEILHEAFGLSQVLQHVLRSYFGSMLFEMMIQRIFDRFERSFVPLPIKFLKLWNAIAANEVALRSLYLEVVDPPAFGLDFKTFRSVTEICKMPGISRTSFYRYASSQ